MASSTSSDPQSLIRSGVANVIGVLVPPAAHLEVAAMAIEAGCHVLIEKPVALGMAHADKLVELASKHDVRVLMGFHMRWHRLIRRWREYVHSGALGIIESIRTIWNSPRADSGIPNWKRCRADHVKEYEGVCGKMAQFGHSEKQALNAISAFGPVRRCSLPW